MVAKTIRYGPNEIHVESTSMPGLKFRVLGLLPNNAEDQVHDAWGEETQRRKVSQEGTKSNQGLDGESIHEENCLRHV